MLNDMSGPYADNAGEGSVTAAKMAAKDFMQKHPEFKDPKASRSKWDLLKNVGVLSGPEAFRPPDQGGCAMAD